MTDDDRCPDCGHSLDMDHDLRAADGCDGCTKCHPIDETLFDQDGDRISFEKAVGGRWMVLVGGIQWAPAGQPRDLSGAGAATYPTRKAARETFMASETAWEKKR